MCETLESRLNRIPLHDLNPSIDLFVIDIDGSEVHVHERERYTFEVPVLVIECKEFTGRVQLPRLSPRLNDESLMAWLQKMLDKHKSQNKPE